VALDLRANVAKKRAPLMRWNVLPHAIRNQLGAASAAVAIVVAGCSPAPTLEKVARDNGRDEGTTVGQYTIEITGSKKRWHVRYPDFSGRLRADDDRVLRVRNIHVPLKTRCVLVLKSTDYVYTFAIPEHGLKEIAVPNLEFRMEFYSDKPGKFELIGEPLCGDPHSLIAGHIVVDPHDRFAAWLDRRF
jgi:heme/copper-type cytochrome/quinol oxidase subunit 2